MSNVTFDGIVYSASTLESMTGSQLVNLHNQVAKKLGKKPVNRFSTKNVAIERTDDLLQMLPKTVEVDHSRSNAIIAKALAGEVDRKVVQRVMRTHSPAPLRGTKLAAPGHAPLPCREGSKQARMVDLLMMGGVSMDYLCQQLDWERATVRSGFGWDMKQKGYGVRSVIENDQETFQLVLPIDKSTGKPYPVPAHTPRKTPKVGV